MTAPDDRLTGPEVAALARVTPDTVRVWRRTGRLVAAGRQPGGRWLYRRGDVEKLLAAHAAGDASGVEIVRDQLAAFLSRRALESRRGA